MEQYVLFTFTIRLDLNKVVNLKEEQEASRF